MPVRSSRSLTSFLLIVLYNLYRLTAPREPLSGRVIFLLSPLPIVFVENVAEPYEQMDVFGYPLNPRHFGTGEQAVREAMFVGLPIVAFDNLCEKEIIQNGVTGLLVKDTEEYIAAIKSVYKINP